MSAAAEPAASMVMSAAGSSPVIAQNKSDLGSVEEDAGEGEEIAQLWDAVFEGDKLTIESFLVGDEEHPPLSGASVDMKVLDRQKDPYFALQLVSMNVSYDACVGR
eukprot:1593536-Pleurochrysis_carterae.AAC.4